MLVHKCKCGVNNRCTIDGHTCQKCNGIVDWPESNHPEELHQALQCRDALQLLCDRGYDLQDLLTICEKEIVVLTNNIQGGTS